MICEASEYLSQDMSIYIELVTKNTGWQTEIFEPIDDETSRDVDARTIRAMDIKGSFIRKNSMF